MLKTLNELLEIMQSRKKQLYTSLVLSFLESCLLVVPIIVAFQIIGSIPELFPAAKTPLTTGMVIQYATVMLICVLARIILRYSTLWLRSGVGYEVMCEQRKLLGQELRKVSMGYFNQKNLGDLVSTITSDASFIELDGMGVVEKAAIGVPSVIIGMALLFYFDYRAGLATALLLIPAYFAYRHLAATQDRLDLNRQEQVGAVTEDAVEFVKGLSVLKTYNMAEKQFFKTKVAFAKLRALSVKIELSHIPPAAVFQLCFRIITVAIILLSGISAVRGEITFQSAFFLMLGAFSLFSGVELMGIYSVFSRLTQLSIDRINQIKNIPKMDDFEGHESFDHYDVAFEKVTFAYESKPVLENISFAVPEKTTTALVGLSGSGKTTVTNLIARFWDVTQGRVLIGGKDVKSVPYETLLKNLSFVFQDVFLFDDTVLNNIRIGRPDASWEEVADAARRAGCHEFICQMENVYDTLIGEAGARLSGGERQRISIARALIKNAPIVLLDEVTANVDVENEQQIQAALQELLKDRTVVMIAHKLSTLQHVDQILVIEDGRIRQKGTHKELSCQDGLYKRLWDMQFQTSHWKL